MGGFPELPPPVAMVLRLYISQIKFHNRPGTTLSLNVPASTPDDN